MVVFVAVCLEYILLKEIVFFSVILLYMFMSSLRYDAQSKSAAFWRRRSKSALSYLQI